jgi:hypothetical protein
MRELSRATGEFVEGMEKLKLVVNKTFKGFKEFQSALFDEIDEADCSDDEGGIDDDDAFNDLQFDSDLAHDIEELGEEERQMLRLADPDAEDADGEPALLDMDTKPPATEPDIVDERGLGTSEVDAIALSDDEGSDEPDEPVSQSTGSDSLKPEVSAATIGDAPEKSHLTSFATGPSTDPSDLLSDARMYRIVFGDATLGLDVTLVEGRVVVARVSSWRLERFGADAKPAVGDILVAVGGHALSVTTNLEPILHYLRSRLKNPPVELMFLEAPRFVERFQVHAMKIQAHLAKRQKEAAASAAAPGLSGKAPSSDSSDDVIDLLLDE